MSTWDKVRDQKAFDRIIAVSIQHIEPAIDEAVKRFLDGFERDYRAAIARRGRTFDE